MYNDKTQGKEFRFEISGLAVNLNYLTIDEKTGEVFVHKPIDREEYPCFHVSRYEIRDLSSYKGPLIVAIMVLTRVFYSTGHF